MNYAKYSLISDNGWSWVLHHSLDWKPMTPFVDQYIHGSQYIKLLQKYEWLDLSNIKEIKNQHIHDYIQYDNEYLDHPFSVIIDDKVIIHPVHNETFEDFKYHWMNNLPKFDKSNIAVKIRLAEDKLKLPDLGKFPIYGFKKVFITNAGILFDQLAENYLLPKYGNYAYNDHIMIQKHSEISKYDIRNISKTVLNWFDQ